MLKNVQDEDVFEIFADVPGVKKDAIRLRAARGTITISVSEPQESLETPKTEARLAIDRVASYRRPELPAAAKDVQFSTEEASDESSQAMVYIRERPQRFAERSVPLPETADIRRAFSKCVAGVLTVTVPKKTVPSPARITVK